MFSSGEADYLIVELTTQDFTPGTFFNRIIDDGKASDNTRHMSHHPATGGPFLLPPERIRRVLLVSGAVSSLFSYRRRL